MIVMHPPIHYGNAAMCRHPTHSGALRMHAHAHARASSIQSVQCCYPAIPRAGSSRFVAVKLPTKDWAKNHRAV